MEIKFSKLDYIYWSTFLLFTLSQMKSLSFLKGLIIVNFVLYYIFFIVLKQNNKFKFRYADLLLIFISVTFILLGFFFTSNFNYYIIYYLFVYLSIKETLIPEKKLVGLINKTAIIYLLLSVLLNYTPLNVLMSYEIRDIPNKFYSRIDRFIGLEGSPAGPDIFYLIVLLINIFYIKEKKIINYFYIVLSIVVMFWTSSLSNIAGLLGAILFLLFPRLKLIIFIVLALNFHNIIVYLYSNFGVEGRIILDKLTTKRAMIWYEVNNNFDLQFNIAEKYFGSSNLVSFKQYTGLMEDNPHNLYIFLQEKFGYIYYGFIYILLIIKVYLEKNKSTMFLIVLYSIYFATNAGILSTWSEPINTFVIFYLLTINRRKKIEIRDINGDNA